MKKCGVFGVIPDGACGTHRDKDFFFFTENNLHRQTGYNYILFHITLHGSVTPNLRSGKFYQFMSFVR